MYIYVYVYICIYVYIYMYIYIYDLTIALNKCDTGCVVGNSNINHLMYADDLVILFPSAFMSTIYIIVISTPDFTNLSYK